MCIFYFHSIFETKKTVLFTKQHTENMIEHILIPLVPERFKNDAHYREGHLRVINALPARKVLGLHTPEIKQTAKQLSSHGCRITLNNGTHGVCTNGKEVIARFEAAPPHSLNYEETVIWGYLINLEKCTLQERLAMLERYIPVLDNWAVCDAYCANAKWMARADKEILWTFLQRWFSSHREFEVRFAIVAAMCYFLDEEWLGKVFKRIETLDFNAIASEYKSVKGKPNTAQQGTVQGALPYYVRMGAAWLLATALAKFPEQTRAFARASQLPDDVIRLYTRKARESFRTRHMSAL